MKTQFLPKTLSSVICFFLGWVLSAVSGHADGPVFRGTRGSEPTVYPQWVDRRDLKSLLVAADAGSLSARITLGWRFAYGIGTPLDRLRACTFLQLAAETADPRGGYLWSQVVLAFSPDPGVAAMAIDHLKAGAASGFGPSANLLAHLPAGFPGIDSSPLARTANIKTAANAGIVEAMEYMYNFSNTGSDPAIPKSPDNAKAWWTKIIAKLQGSPTDFEIEDLRCAAAMLLNPNYSFSKDLRTPDRIAAFVRAGAELGDQSAMVMTYFIYRQQAKIVPPFTPFRTVPPPSPPIPDFLPQFSETEASSNVWRAAFLGNPDAMFFVADEFFRAGNQDLSDLWLRAAADRSAIQAVSVLRDRKLPHNF